MPTLTLAELQARLGGAAQGDTGASVSGAASLEHAGPHQLSFIVSAKYLAQARASGAGVLIVPESLAEPLPQPCLAVANPHAVFARAVALLHAPPAPPVGIHPSAVVADDAVIGADARIGPGVVIGAGAVIGPRCVIDAGCVIGAGASLGEDCLLHPRVTLHHGCIVGARAVLHPGCVIGSDGFGLAWDGDHWLKVPQVGRVVLGDDVEVGANTTIDRGALDDTVIEDGVKLDNLIHIAHNCRVGRHTAIAACTGVAGSARIGAYCQIGGAAMIMGHSEICDRVVVSAGTFVSKDIREPGAFTSILPHMPHADWKKNIAQMRHLDTLARRVKALERALESTQTDNPADAAPQDPK